MTETQPKSIMSRLLQGIKWNFLDVIIVSVGNLAISILAARLLGVDEFGAFSIVKSTVYMLATVAGLGLGWTATKYIAELKSDDLEKMGRILGLCQLIAGSVSFVFAGSLFFFAFEIANGPLQAPHLVDPLQMAAVYILFTTLNGYQIGAMMGFEAFRKLAFLNCAQTLFSLICTGVFIWSWGLAGAASALGLTAFLNWVLYHKALRKEMRNYGVKVSYVQLGREMTVLMSFAFPAAISGIIGSMAVWMGNALLVRQEHGLAELALFAVAGNIRSLVIFFPSLVTRVASPMLCSVAGEKTKNGYARLFWINIVVTICAAVIVAISAVLLAPWILAAFGKGYSGGVGVLAVIAVMSVIEVAANSFYQTLFVHGRLWWQVGVIVLWSATLLGVTAATVESEGAIGLGYAYVAAHSVSLCCYMLATFYLKAWRVKKEEAGS